MYMYLSRVLRELAADEVLMKRLGGPGSR